MGPRDPRTDTTEPGGTSEILVGAVSAAFPLPPFPQTRCLTLCRGGGEGHQPGELCGLLGWGKASLVSPPWEQIPSAPTLRRLSCSCVQVRGTTWPQHL